MASPSSSSSSPASAAPTEPNFTASLEQLGQVVEQLRGQSLPLEEALALFEAGMGHLKQCQQVLSQSKGRMQVLGEELDNLLSEANEPNT
jgi:exodeoxyribonuclease VII small subunit